MRVDVFGTGALAMLYGARLAVAGAHVRLIGTWPAGLRAIRQRGVTVQASGLERRIRVEAVHLSDAVRAGSPGAPLVLVLVKSHQTPAIAPFVVRAVALDGSILTLQNGLTAHAVLSRSASGGRVVQGLTTQAARVIGAGTVRHAGGGATVLPQGADWIAGPLESAGFPVRCSPTIEAELWTKVAVSCAINPLTALHSVPNGALLEKEAWRRQMASAAREVERVAAASGVTLARDPAEAAFRVALNTRSNRSSMLQDLDRCARTEIDALCGAVVRRGRRHGVATPVNAHLWRRILEIESAPSSIRVAGARTLAAFGGVS